jgi:elongator complex protein 5
VLASFEKLMKPPLASHFISCPTKTEQKISTAIRTAVSAATGASLVIIDTIHPLISNQEFNFPAFLASFMSPNTSVVILCHIDIPFSIQNDISLDALSLLKYVATAILTVHSLTHIIEKKKARDRSIAEPAFGLDESVEGVLVGMGSNYKQGTVIEMEHRRKSGRTVKEWFFIYHSSHSSSINTPGSKVGQKVLENLILLEDHPLYPQPADSRILDNGKDTVDSTFNLGLTEKERKDRDAVLLPYFDAQNEGGVGEGGRILYDMGVEDDFDEEEDEI